MELSKKQVSQIKRWMQLNVEECDQSPTILAETCAAALDFYEEDGETPDEIFELALEWFPEN